MLGGEHGQMSPQHFECKSFWHLCIVFEKFRMSLFWQPRKSDRGCKKAVLHLLFTIVTDTKRFPPRLNLSKFFFFFFLNHNGDMKKKFKVKTHSSPSCSSGCIWPTRNVVEKNVVIVNVAVWVCSVVVLLSNTHVEAIADPCLV